MSVQIVTHEHIEEAANRSARIAADVNRMIKREGFGYLVATNKIVVTINAASCLPEDYINGMKRWSSGALSHLIGMMEEKPNKKWFKSGSFGSIWFDAELEGDGKTKYTRVTLCPESRHAPEGGFLVMLDPTFDEEW